ncbi:Glu/Leu/Phe/Val family dehydrogenase [Paenarthrobacter histidinolovorans]|uniref:Glu/Leu/Phe/Val family dehydrogenase n=1 Tax=Paenarthrobacter histidinolovorans TaxID=43664 RepID=UPI001987AEA6|nr:Glu/Leu/Phe/Val dehydrogenase dimerization domain-containing protein [Paenarthrobacter histidinolovorans]GGJ40469.1 glutamate dehydrogenase [Paenarthrobacter histidinolovorans]
MAEDVFEMIDEWGPEKIVVVSDRRTGMRGVLVLDNTARGSGKGGTRMSPSLTVREVARLARTMTWKWAAVDLFHGGAKAGILGEPKDPNKEAILRAFARALSNEVPSEYVFGLDMGLSEADAAVFLDELGDRGVSTGLPRALGGLPYDQLGVTGYGVAEAAEAAAENRGMEICGSRVAIQGFGAVGQAAAARLVELGAVVVAVSTAVGTVHDPDGIDVSKLIELRSELGDECVLHYGKVLPVGFALAVETDILIPAAREDTVTDLIAAATSAKLIVEGANLPTSPSSRAILHGRGILVVPDFIANAGGIVAAAHSMAARYSPFVLEPADIFAMISTKLRSNTAAVLNESARLGLTPHQAAYNLAQKRVGEAMRLRRQTPIPTETVDMFV